jgi:hypothetical protein
MVFWRCAEYLFRGMEYSCLSIIIVKDIRLRIWVRLVLGRLYDRVTNGITDNLKPNQNLVENGLYIANLWLCSLGILACGI